MKRVPDYRHANHAPFLLFKLNLEEASKARGRRVLRKKVDQEEKEELDSGTSCL
jgi:hypothetical protein